MDGVDRPQRQLGAQGAKRDISPAMKENVAMATKDVDGTTLGTAEQVRPPAKNPLKEEAHVVMFAPQLPTEKPES